MEEKLFVWDDNAKLKDGEKGAYIEKSDITFDSFVNELKKRKGSNYVKIIKDLKSKQADSNIHTLALDGVLDSEEYASQDTRILFLLKEAYDTTAKSNDGLYVWDELEWVRNNIDTINNPTWKRLFQWSYLILNKEIKTNLDPGEKEKLLKHIAVINIKKFDGKTPSKDKELRKLAKKDNDADLIMQQIEMINPTIIVCGHTGWLLEKVIKNITGKKMREPKNNNWIYYHKFNDKEIPVIDFWHPANTNSDLLLLEDLHTIINNESQPLKTKRKANFDNTVK